MPAASKQDVGFRFDKQRLLGLHMDLPRLRPACLPNPSMCAVCAQGLPCRTYRLVGPSLTAHNIYAPRVTPQSCTAAGGIEAVHLDGDAAQLRRVQPLRRADVPPGHDTHLLCPQRQDLHTISGSCLDAGTTWTYDRYCNRRSACVLQVRAIRRQVLSCQEHCTGL